MKIKTITCHEVYNFGASLQAFALQEYLTKLGNDVEVIDYKPHYLDRHYKLWCVDNPRFDRFGFRFVYNFLKLPKRIKALKSGRKQNFDEFTNKYINKTKLKYISNERLKGNLPEADVYLAGSDQIWNTIFNNGKDPAFYLDFVPKEEVKASYAASFSTDKIYDDYESKVKEWVSNLDYVSVREQSGIEILNNLGIENAECVLDPVFLLEKEDWLKVLKKTEVPREYIFVYDFDRNEVIKEYVLDLAKAENLKICSVFDADWADYCYSTVGPDVFLYLINNAKYVVSNSFHATAFSVIFNKPFVVFNREEGINARMRDLVDMLHLGKENFNVDYNKVNKLLEEKKQSSKLFLEKVLNNVKAE